MRKTLALLFVSVAACGGGGDSPTGPVPGANTTNGTFTATVDGQAWASTSNQISTTGAGTVPGYVVLTGTKIVSATSYTTITLALGYIAGPGAYPLGVNQLSTAGGSAIVLGTQGSGIGTWSTNFSGNAGTVTISSITATRIVGTFQFSAPPQSFSTTTGTRVVSNGAFDLPLPGNFALAPATNKGNKVTGTIGGVAWNAATIVGGGSGGSFAIGASTDSLNLSLASGRTVAAGSTYPIGGTSGGLPGASMVVTKTGTSSGWTSSGGTAAVGSFTVTSMTGGRVAGSFTASLAGTGGALAVSGTFDVRIDVP